MTEHDTHHALDTAQFIRDCTTQYPEMEWLIGADRLATPDFVADTSGRSVGAQLFPHTSEESLSEFNRTALSLLAVEWVLSGDYEAFTACQADADRLSRESFGDLKAYTQSILVDDNAKEALRVSLIIKDLSKNENIIERLAAETGLQEISHDAILVEALKRFPDVTPSFSRLTPYDQELVLKALETQFKLGQFIQGENVAASLDGLQDLSQAALDLQNLEALFDIASAAGHSTQDGSMIITESTCQNFGMAVNALADVHSRPLAETYDAFLQQKANQLGIDDITDPTDRALTRLSCMFHYATPEQTANLRHVFGQLPAVTQAILEHELAQTGIDDGYATLLYYAPALLNNLQRVYDAQAAAGQLTEQEAIEQALYTSCRTLSQLFMQARIQLQDQTGNGVYTVFVEIIAKTAATEPARLQQDQIRIKRIDAHKAIATLEPLAQIESELNR